MRNDKTIQLKAMQKAQEQADMQRMKDQAKFQEEISKRKAKEDELLLEVKGRERET